MTTTNDQPAVLADAETLASAVFQALGAASTCWESLAGTGVFDDSRAKAIGDELLEGIRSRRWPDAAPQPLLDAAEVQVEFTWPAETPPDFTGTVTRSTVGFQTLEEARAFRGLLNEAIRQADRRGADQPYAFAESVDAQEWAQAFLTRFAEERVSNDGPVDEGLLIAWFANAIETGRRAGDAWPDRPKFAGEIRVVRGGGRVHLEVDNRPFPWHCADPVDVQIGRKGRPGVTLRLLAARVEVVDALAPAERIAEIDR